MFFYLLASDVSPLRVLQTQLPIAEIVINIITQNNTHPLSDDIKIERVGLEVWVTFNARSMTEEQMQKILMPLFSLLNTSPNDFLFLRHHAVANLGTGDEPASYTFSIADIERAFNMSR